jgi:hypothetical protein
MPTIPRPKISPGSPFEKLNTKAIRAFTNFYGPAQTDFFDHARWEQAHDHQLGIYAWDAVGHKCGLNVCTSSLLKSYVPVDRYKQTLVGKMLDYSFYNPLFSGDEADWNLLIDPDPQFKFILDDVVQAMEPRELAELQTRNGAAVVECEITPDENFYNNGWFTENDHGSVNIGKKVAAYGPWVRDGGHGGRPEIHPCEIVWWHDPATARNLERWVMLVVQDDSNRFDRKSDFAGSIPRGWSQPPRMANFAMALQLHDNYQYTFNLALGRHRNMADLHGPGTSPAQLTASVPSAGPVGVAPPRVEVIVNKAVRKSRDVVSGDKTTSSVVNGATIPASPDTGAMGLLDAKLSKIVEDPIDPKVFRAFLTLQTQVGTLNAMGGEGYAEIFLELASVKKIQPGAVISLSRPVNRQLLLGAGQIN